MKLNVITTTLALSFLLVGCGSDSNDKVDLTEPEQGYKNDKYVVMDVNHQPVADKIHYVALGRFDDKIKTWMNSDQAEDLDGDGRISFYDAQKAGVENPPIDYLEVNSSDVVAFLTENPDGYGQHTSRPDIFVEGQYSVFDVLRYVVHSDPQLKFDSVTPAEESPYNTFEFSISYDANNDGDFTNDGDEFVNSPNWFFRFKTSAGDFQRATGEPNGEATYNRMDEMWAQHDLAIRFQPFHEVTTVRRQHLWEKEMARLDENGQVISEILVRDGNTPYPYPYVQNLKVTAHNLRPDVFQPGVITGIDWFMSAIDEGYDFKLSYWPTLDTGASVNSYSVNHVNGITSSVGEGWVNMMGEKEVATDYGPLPACLWDKEGKTASVSAFPAEDCIDDFQYAFGGNKLHLMTDVWVMSYPKEYGMLVYANHYNAWGMEEYNGNDLGKEYEFSNGLVANLETLNSAKDANSDAMLTESHYGWGKADCMLCHNPEDGHMNGAPLPVNTNDGFDIPQPYFCSTCHGTNGASEGHGATARCFWCHSSSKTPEFHGDAFSKRTVPSIIDAINEEKDIFFYNNGSPVMPRDSAGNPNSYPDKGIISGANSDWSMSQTFPDPYSCMTCHDNGSFDK
ncbi:hypothetical protein [Shewanella sp. 10N.286.52.B9]|uniref:hypothetical protein n=1 Tax=Shewanella sp. 10N.286.52.B9 TaxID=1880837 RepID=UPI000C840EC8|nr:hypothetical protein [Shewanella sp. 10N.286.52.B9]PMG51941.1 hypothetical protein BCU91_15935 [Shewanella sp. 10N.286.52.B9]